MTASPVRLPRVLSYVRVQVSVMTIACIAFALATAPQPWAQVPDWQQTARELSKQQNFDLALRIVEAQLLIEPNNLEAHGWRGRLLAWKGRWAEAENEYRLVLQHAPDDVDILSALADVLLWQNKADSALEIVDRARERAPCNEEVLLRRARILQVLGRGADAREQLREIVRRNGANKQAKSLLSGIGAEYKHELRLGNDVDFFNYTDAALAQVISLNSRWTPYLSTFVGSEIHERFSRKAAKVDAEVVLRPTTQDWLGFGGAAAQDNGIIPKAETTFEYGHGFRFQNHAIRGIEDCFRQRWLWYRGAHVLTLTAAQTYYLPRDFSWTLTVTGARSGFTNSGVDWVPSGSTRLRFPLHSRLTGNLSFGIGTESYAQVDQIGRFSARTFAGGLQFHFAANQDFSSYVACQNRSQHRSQTSYGLSYGIHF